MKLRDFLAVADQHSWTSEPCLYIIKHPITTETVFRCGASGTKLHQSLDPVYSSSQQQTVGFQSRVRLYDGFWYPAEGRIVACLQIPRQLVANLDTDRIAQDSAGNQFNVNRGSRTLVLEREAQFHAVLDSMGLRRPGEVGKELFVGPESKLITAMRRIIGVRMYLFNESGIVEDSRYDPKFAGRQTRNMPAANIISTQPRQQPDRPTKVQTITFKLSKESIEQLRNATPAAWEKIINILLELEDDIIRKPPEVVEPVSSRTRSRAKS